MKKRDMIILFALIILVVAFTAWEQANRQETESAQSNARSTERVALEKRLANTDLRFDSLSTRVLRIIDSLKFEAAAFESLAKRSIDQLAEAAEEIKEPVTEEITPRAEEVVPTDTLPQMIQTTYSQAMAALPKDLTKYERKIAVREVESTVMTKYDLTHDEFANFKKAWKSSGS